MTTILCTVFFFSGASALIFEMLWFHLAGITFGNSVWATAIVLSSFMGGLALGNGLTALWGHRIKSPIRFYAFIEITIAISGFALVLVFPNLTELLVPMFRVFTSQPLVLNALRGIIAILLMLVPATAMGATLPVLVKALYAEKPNYGTVLGTLYGWNTLGAMFGVLCGEVYFIQWLGVTRSGLVAVSFNLIAAAVAIRLSVIHKEIHDNHIEAKDTATLSPFSRDIRRLLLASFLSGLTLLALEVVWFRFIILFFSSHSLNFALMLAAVLAGISLGGICASGWFELRSEAHRSLTPILLLSGTLVVVLYGNFGFALDMFQKHSPEVRISFVSFFLTFPVSFVSGIVFTMLGKALHSQIKAEIETAGLLTLANTTGAMLGSILAAFILVPCMGIEKAFFLLASAYGAIAFLTFDTQQVLRLKAKRASHCLMTGIFVVALVLFPFGIMNGDFLPRSYAGYKNRGEKRIALREGLTETIQYLEKDLLGEPYYHRLMTNNFAMSDTYVFSKRYMKLFVYLPVAVHPELKDALLICYGCGSTAKALTDTKSLENIDIVDISRDVLEMSSIVFPDPENNPVCDTRVRLHIEDGRFFLLTTERKFDLITAEPPPPASKGIANLYSQEFFSLIYDRLSDGGIVSYWLPGHLLEVSEAKSILKGFCNVFADCSLWVGAGFNFMMVGTKSLEGPVAEREFARQWKDPVVGPEMRALGFESPEQFGSLFIADGQRLQSWISDSPPLVDDYPRRVSYGGYKVGKQLLEYRDFMDCEASQKNFIASEGISRMWPEPLQKRALEEYFSIRQAINEMNLDPRLKRTSLIMSLHRCVQEPLLENYILWACWSDEYAQRIISKVLEKETEESCDDIQMFYGLAAEAARDRDYLLAEHYLGMAADKFETEITVEGLYYISAYRMYFLFMAGEKNRAREIGQEYIYWSAAGRDDRRKQITEYWTWLVSAAGVPDPSREDTLEYDVF